MTVGAARLLPVLAVLALAPPDSRADSFNWDDVADARPSTEYELAMVAGDQYTERAARAHQRGMKLDAIANARRAVQEYERAAEIDSKKAEPHYRAAEVLYGHWVANVQQPPRELADRAISHWTEWQRKAPRDTRLESALFRRSITYTKLGGDDNFRKAAKDYELQLGLSDTVTVRSSENTATVLSNAAELYMGIGELDSSIQLFQEAVGLRDDPLYGYGLALALERDGQGTKAREVMRYYASVDHLRALTRDGVFFVPDGDIYAYYGLGYEALGEGELATRHYREFLAKQPHGRYSDLVRERLKTLKTNPPKKPDAGQRPIEVEVKEWLF